MLWPLYVMGIFMAVLPKFVLNKGFLMRHDLSEETIEKIIEFAQSLGKSI